MTTGQTIVAAILWVVLLGLLALVLLLYRHVDRAYSSNDFGKNAGLMPGVEVPPIEIMTNAGPEILLTPKAEEGTYLLAFVNADCAGCAALFETLRKERVFKGTAIAILVQPVPVGHPMHEAPPNVEMHGAASPADVRRHFGITFVPMVYLMRGTRVLVAGGGATENEVRELVAKAKANEAGAMAAEAPELEVVQRQMARSDA